MSVVLHYILKLAALIALILLYRQYHYPLNQQVASRMLSADGFDRRHLSGLLSSDHNKDRPLESFKKIKFAHSTLKLRDFDNADGTGDKHEGLVATEAVLFGTVLAVEYPMIRLSSKCGQEKEMHFAKCVHDLVNQQREHDQEFSDFWDGLELMEDDVSSMSFDYLKVCEIDDCAFCCTVFELTF